VRPKDGAYGALVAGNRRGGPGAQVTHFTFEQWADFLRGIGLPAGRVEMARHLDSGCPRCSGVVAALSTVGDVVRDDGAFPVPDDLFRRARAIFPQPAGGHPDDMRPVGRLVHDSLAASVPAGVRATDSAARDLRYETPDAWIDVRLARDRGSRRVLLTGQITPRVEPDAAIGIVVLVVEGTVVLATAITTDFGEFQLEYEPSARTRLRIPLARRGPVIDVPLERLGPRRAAFPAVRREQKR